LIWTGLLEGVFHDLVFAEGVGWSIKRMPSPSPFLGVFLDQIILSILEARNPTFGFRATYLKARFQSYLYLKQASQHSNPELSISKSAV